MSQWHPDPPIWYKRFAASAAALEPPSLEGVPPPAVTADQLTFAHPEGIHPPPVPAAAHLNAGGPGGAQQLSPRAIQAELKRLKGDVVGDFMDILEVVSHGDPTDREKPEELRRKHESMAAGTSRIHDLLRTYRQHQAYELLISHMEQSIADCKTAKADLAAARQQSTAAVENGT